MLILHGLQFKRPITKEVEDIEDAICAAIGWLPADDEMIGQAYPVYVSDETGKVILTEDELHERMESTGLV